MILKVIIWFLNFRRFLFKTLIINSIQLTVNGTPSKGNKWIFLSSFCTIISTSFASFKASSYLVWTTALISGFTSWILWIKAFTKHSQLNYKKFGYFFLFQKIIFGRQHKPAAFESLLWCQQLSILKPDSLLMLCIAYHEISIGVLAQVTIVRIEVIKYKIWINSSSSELNSISGTLSPTNLN